MLQSLQYIDCRMSSPQDEPQQAKKEEEAPDLKSCEKCMKFFTNEFAFLTHLKMKHEQSQPEQASSEEQEEESEEEEVQGKAESKNPPKKQGNKNLPVRSRMRQTQRNELQDNIYTFLGELGEKNVEAAPNRPEIINISNDQKLTGQTNYSVNKVIRTPYEEPIKCSDEIPLADIENSKNRQFLLGLRQELTVLEAKVEEQRQMWQLRDPMAAEQEVMDEFSLMDIAKLIHNYPKRKIDIANPHFSIFLLWIGRVCKSSAFREFYLILAEYLAEYHATEASSLKDEQAYDNWKNHHKLFEAKQVDEGLLLQLFIFQEKSCRKLVEYFVQWVILFRGLSIQRAASER